MRARTGMAAVALAVALQAATLPMTARADMIDVDVADTVGKAAPEVDDDFSPLGHTPTTKSSDSPSDGWEKEKESPAKGEFVSCFLAYGIGFALSMTVVIYCVNRIDR